MKIEEELAKNFLSTLKLGRPIYEPNKNNPPDFLLDNGIAVEVRRLNQNYFEGTQRKGLEETAITVKKVFNEAVDQLNQLHEKTYILALSFKRPIDLSRGKLKSLFLKALKDLLDTGITSSKEIKVNENIMIIAHPAEHKRKELFFYAVTSDGNSGGRLVNMYIKNINHCIKEKEKKIKTHFDKYLTWWLLLVDHIVGKLPEFDKSSVQGEIIHGDTFSRIMVMNPNTCQLSLDWPGSTSFPRTKFRN